MKTLAVDTATVETDLVAWRSWVRPYSYGSGKHGNLVVQNSGSLIAASRQSWRVGEVVSVCEAAGISGLDHCCPRMTVGAD